MTSGDSTVFYPRYRPLPRISSPRVASAFRNVAISLALVACYGGASLLNFTLGFEQLPPLLAGLRFGLIGGGLGIVFLLGITEKKEVYYRPKAKMLLSIWTLFSLANVTAAIIIGEVMYATLTECWLLLGVPLFFFYLLPRSAVGCIHRINTNAIIIVAAGYLLYSVYESPDFHFLYRGVFGHANQAGTLASMLSVGCIAVLLSWHRGERKLKLKGLILIVLLLVFGVSIILISGSRTSLLAFATAISATIFFVHRVVRRLLICFVIVLAIVLSLLSTGTETGIAWIDAVLEKHQSKSRSGDVLSGRTVVWETILADTKIFGNGSTYFANNVGISAHNSFLNTLGRRGTIATALLLAFAALSIICTFRYALNSNAHELEATGSFLFIVHFWSLSMGEANLSSLGTIITLSFYSAMGAMMTHNKTLNLRSVAPTFNLRY